MYCIIIRLGQSACVQACKEMQSDGNYRPRLVYVVVQKRHHVRLFKNGGGKLTNLDPGTAVDSTITSPYLFDFYLNSHKALQGTSRIPRYTCLLDELGFGPDGLILLSYWLCYLYCRCNK
jgi:eukaryotic translation initiation factor 2C